MKLLWDPCIHHRGDDARDFIRQYFADDSRQCLLICGAGFDPRATESAKELSKATGHRLKAIFIREDRPNPDDSLLASADGNQQALEQLIQNNVVHHVPVFSDDQKTVVGGRRIIDFLGKYDLNGVTDILVDMSALSIGISFPVVRYLYDKSRRQSGFPNVHLLVTTSSSVDGAVSAELMGKIQEVHGFDRALGTIAEKKKPKLWLPQLGRRAKDALELILQNMEFEEICPILPFPASDPRAVEALVEDYQGQISESWLVDDRDFLYAAENDPLDLYRTILRVESQRQKTYEVEGGSITVLSPLGTKAMALGALLSALERDLPIVYVEALRYNIRPTVATEAYGLIHLWLTGEVYPVPLPD